MAQKNDGMVRTGDQPRMSEKAINQYAERTPNLSYRQPKLGSTRDQRSYRSYGRG